MLAWCPYPMGAALVFVCSNNIRLRCCTSILQVCEDDQDFFLLHGALLLFTWLFVAPPAIYFARYRTRTYTEMNIR